MNVQIVSEMLERTLTVLTGYLIFDDPVKIEATLGLAQESIEASLPEGPQEVNKENPRKAYLLHAPTAGMYVVCGELGVVETVPLTTPLFVFFYSMKGDPVGTIYRGRAEAFFDANVLYDSLVSAIRLATATPEDVPAFRVWSEATAQQPAIGKPFACSI